MTDEVIGGYVASDLKRLFTSLESIPWPDGPAGQQSPHPPASLLLLLYSWAQGKTLPQPTCISKALFKSLQVEKQDQDTTTVLLIDYAAGYNMLDYYLEKQVSILAFLCDSATSTRQHKHDHVPWTVETRATPACAAARNCRSPAASQWFFQPGLDDGRGSVGRVAPLRVMAETGVNSLINDLINEAAEEAVWKDARPRSLFWSMCGAAASMEAVSGSGPWMCTGASITGAGTTWRHQGHQQH